MRSVHPDDRADADLTAQAKIRNAAIAQFATDGFQKTNLRAIAAEAGVSASLVIHHFGSKEKLRMICDEYVLEVLLARARSDSSVTGMGDVVSEYLADPTEYHLEVQYMARAIAEDSPAAARFADSMVDESEAILRAGMLDGSMRSSSDPRALAVLTVLTSLAMLTIPRALARAFGPDISGPAAMKRIALPALEIYTHGLYTNDTFLTAVIDLLVTAQPDQGSNDD
jgi:AcrR family transcriptional regulator